MEDSEVARLQDWMQEHHPSIDWSGMDMSIAPIPNKKKQVGLLQFSLDGRQYELQCYRYVDDNDNDKLLRAPGKLGTDAARVFVDKISENCPFEVSERLKNELAYSIATIFNNKLQIDKLIEDPEKLGKIYAEIGVIDEVLETVERCIEDRGVLDEEMDGRVRESVVYILLHLHCLKTSSNFKTMYRRVGKFSKLFNDLKTQILEESKNADLRIMKQIEEYMSPLMNKESNKEIQTGDITNLTKNFDLLQVSKEVDNSKD